MKSLLALPFITALTVEAKPVPFDIHEAFKKAGALKSYTTALVNMHTRVTNWKTVITRYKINQHYFEYTHDTKMVEVTSNINSLRRTYEIKNQKDFDYMMYSVKSDIASDKETYQIISAQGYLTGMGYERGVKPDSFQDNIVILKKKGCPSLIYKHGNNLSYIGNEDSRSSTPMYPVRHGEDIRQLFLKGLLV